MKQINRTLVFLCISSLLAVSSCKKDSVVVDNLSEFDTIINVDVIIQFQNMANWEKVYFKSFLHNKSGKGASYYAANNNLVHSFPGDTSHIQICSDTSHYNFPVKFSKTEPVDFLIALQISSLHGSIIASQSIIFTWYPASRTATSTIFPLRANAFEDAHGSPNTSDTLSTNTAFSATCKPGTLIFYMKCE